MQSSCRNGMGPQRDGADNRTRPQQDETPRHQAGQPERAELNLRVTKKPAHGGPASRFLAGMGAGHLTGWLVSYRSAKALAPTPFS